MNAGEKTVGVYYHQDELVCGVWACLGGGFWFYGGQFCSPATMVMVVVRRGTADFFFYLR